MAMIYVKNLKGTSDNKTTGSWLNHWELGIMEKHPELLLTGDCCVKGCDGTDLVGAHVIKADEKDRRWYIVRVCKKHNNCKDPYLVDDSMLVPVDKDNL